MMSEACESFGRFSMYANVEGKYYPWSFCEGAEGWEDGIDICSADFMRDIWNGEKVARFRELSCDGVCPVYEI
jgi:hypothetical protein